MRLFHHKILKLRSSETINRPFCLKSRRWFTAIGNILQEGDRAVLCYKDDKLVLTKPLCRDGKTTTRFGDVRHDSLIGKLARETVTTSQKWELRAHLPSLEDYITMTPRLVTPIYAKDANLIVSLLDLHPHATLQSPENCSSLEILEAGTGHGALTLHLARAIHAANPRPGETLHIDDIIEGPRPISEPSLPVARSEWVPSPAAATSAFAGYAVEALKGDNAKFRRRAIIHTVDISAKHSEYAAKILKGFRRGQYVNDVEFHVGDISGWIDEQKFQRKKLNSSAADQTFLSHVILDLPSSQAHVEKVLSALHVNGSLLVFNPSITQIVSCVEEIKKKMLPLQLDQVLELGQTTGGREWDVRAAKPRAVIRAEIEKKAKVIDSGVGEPVNDGDASFTTEATSKLKPIATDKGEAHLMDDTTWGMICRPKVGERIAGGGFLGVWRKMRK